MIVDVRGGMGTQILELLGQYALAFERGYEITGIRVNLGGKAWDGGPVQNVLVDYISDVFANLPPVERSQGTAKLAIFKNPDLFVLILKYYEHIFNNLKFRSNIQHYSDRPVLHVRTGNRMMVPFEYYRDYAISEEVALVGNISEDVEKLRGLDLSTGTPIGDWLTLLNSPELVGTASTFLLSVMFVDPIKPVRMWAQQQGDDFTRILGPLLRRVQPYFPRFEWI